MSLCLREAAYIEKLARPADTYDEAVQRCLAVDHHKTQMLAAQYAKKGKRARQEELFPQLQQEIASERLKMDKDIIWPDQTSEKYKEHIAERCQEKVKHLGSRRASKFLNNVVKMFSVCFGSQVAPRHKYLVIALI